VSTPPAPAMNVAVPTLSIRDFHPQEKRELVFKEDGQEYGQVSALEPLRAPPRCWFRHFLGCQGRAEEESQLCRATCDWLGRGNAMAVARGSARAKGGGAKASHLGRGERLAREALPPVHGFLPDRDRREFPSSPRRADRETASPPQRPPRAPPRSPPACGRPRGCPGGTGTPGDRARPLPPPSTPRRRWCACWATGA